MRPTVILVLLLAVLAVSVAFAEPSESGSPTEDVMSDPGYLQPGTLRLGAAYFLNFATDTKTVLTSTTGWEPSNWIKLSLLIGVTTVIADEEEDIQAWVQEHRNADTGNVARIAKPFGDGKYTLPALATLYMVGRLSDNERARSTALLGVESFVVTGIFTETLKHTTHKHRPRTGDLENIVWDGPRATRANLAFPSGHAASAFALATVVASEYRDHRAAPPLAYGAATLCALSRVHDNAHWASDVIIGSAIGYFTARTIVGLHGRGVERNFSVRPMLDEGRAGLSLAYRF
jgi:membrane-associated phospholipid phosphatase